MRVEYLCTESERQKVEYVVRYLRRMASSGPTRSIYPNDMLDLARMLDTALVTMVEFEQVPDADITALSTSAEG